MDVTEILIVLVIGQEHILHLFQMNIGAGFRERRVGVRVGDVLARKDCDIAVCAVDVLLCKYGKCS